MDRELLIFGVDPDPTPLTPPTPLNPGMFKLERPPVPGNELGPPPNRKLKLFGSIECAFPIAPPDPIIEFIDPKLPIPPPKGPFCPPKALWSPCSDPRELELSPLFPPKPAKLSTLLGPPRLLPKLLFWFLDKLLLLASEVVLLEEAAEDGIAADLVRMVPVRAL